MQGSQTQTASHEVIPVPTVISVTEMLNSTSAELRLVGTQIAAYDAYISTKYLNATAAEARSSQKSSHEEFSLEIPISSTISPNLALMLSKATATQSMKLSTEVFVSNRLTIHVEAKAELKGVSIEAKHLEANFNELILESLHNVLESDSKGGNLGIGLQSRSLDAIGAQVQNRKRHVVDTITALLGSETATVVVANALRLNGAIIANAERDPNTGELTDHGHLTCQVGELFVQHIHSFDRGATLGASLNFAALTQQKANGKTESHPYFSLSGTVGAFDMEGWTYATIGQGNVTVLKNPETLAELNRNITKAQTFWTNYNVKPIFFYASNINTGILKRTVAKHTRAWMEGIARTALNTLGFNVKTQAQIEAEEEEARLKEFEEKQREEFNKLKEAYDALPEEGKQEVDKVAREVTDLQAATEAAAKEKAGSKARGFMHGKLKTVAGIAEECLANYQEYETKNPVKAKIVLVAGMVAAKGVVGAIIAGAATSPVGGIGAIPGFFAGIAKAFGDELRGAATGVLLGAQIEKLVDAGTKKFAPWLMKIDPLLTEQDAAMLGTVLLASMLTAKEFGSFAKAAKGVDFGKMKVPSQDGSTVHMRQGGADVKSGQQQKVRVTASSFITGPIKLKDGTIGKLDDLPSYHHQNSKGAAKSKFPKDPIDAFKNSVQGSKNMRIGVDRKHGEYIVFMASGIHLKDGINVFHPHVRPLEKLTPKQRAALFDAGLIDKRGRIS